MAKFTRETTKSSKCRTNNLQIPPNARIFTRIHIQTPKISTKTPENTVPQVFRLSLDRGTDTISSPQIADLRRSSINYKWDLRESIGVNLIIVYHSPPEPNRSSLPLPDLHPLVSPASGSFEGRDALPHWHSSLPRLRVCGSCGTTQRYLSIYQFNPRKPYL